MRQVTTPTGGSSTVRRTERDEQGCVALLSLTRNGGGRAKTGKIVACPRPVCLAKPPTSLEPGARLGPCLFASSNLHDVVYQAGLATPIGRKIQPCMMHAELARTARGQLESTNPASRGKTQKLLPSLAAQRHTSRTQKHTDKLFLTSLTDKRIRESPRCGALKSSHRLAPTRLTRSQTLYRRPSQKTGLPRPKAPASLGHAR
jgi:hypothetical protein